MAISPQRLDTLQEDEAQLVSQLERQIDEFLFSNYEQKAGSARCPISSAIKLPPRMQEELIRRYKSAGWKDVKVERSTGGTYLVVSKHEPYNPYSQWDR